ncbi:hypothetical protein Adt_10536 [Abeliophyllum distichum]|uniref:Uncharacterized protein n=1 Tax=Abeliophyllum distichum TaxID=126358 RepID=A0ABD1UKG4_9LAMI
MNGSSGAFSTAKYPFAGAFSIVISASEMNGSSGAFYAAKYPFSTSEMIGSSGAFYAAKYPFSVHFMLMLYGSNCAFSGGCSVAKYGSSGVFRLPVCFRLNNLFSHFSALV